MTSTYGFDSTFAFYDNLAVNAYRARSQSDGLDGDAASYRAQLDYSGDRYGAQVERLVVGKNFNPEVGYVRRLDMHRSYGQLRFSPRPRGNKYVRRYNANGSLLYIENGAGRMETRAIDSEFAVEFQNNDRLYADQRLLRVPASPVQHRDRHHAAGAGL